MPQTDPSLRTLNSSPRRTRRGGEGPLPLRSRGPSPPLIQQLRINGLAYFYSATVVYFCSALDSLLTPNRAPPTPDPVEDVFLPLHPFQLRSEERRVGQAGSCRWSPTQ